MNTFSIYNPVLGVFGNLPKATFSYIMSLSVRPHKTTLLQLDGFSLSLISEYFSKIPDSLNRAWIMGNLHECQYTFLGKSRSFILRTRNVSDKSCRGNKNTNFMFNNVFSKILHFIYNNVKIIVKPDRPQMTIWRMRVVGWITVATETHSECVILIPFFTATIVTRTRLSVTFIRTSPVLFGTSYFKSVNEIRPFFLIFKINW
jgi:hypothetical protein